jgi:Flp pilus assembly protein protease CpaA
MLLVGLWQKWRLANGTGVTYVLSILLMIFLLYPFFKLGALGAGDVKLLGICAGFLRYDKILQFLFFSLLAAAIFALIKLIRERSVGERLAYLGSYLLDVARSGRWSLYMENEREARRAGVALAGPILVSVFLYMGGVY